MATKHISGLICQWARMRNEEEEENTLFASQPTTAYHDCFPYFHLSTFWTAASLRPMLPATSGSALQVAISSSCHDTVAPGSVVGRFLLQVRQPGTRCQTISVIRRSAKTLLGNR